MIPFSRDLTNYRLRTNPAYELLVLDGVIEQHRVIGAIDNDPDLYGILRPRTPGSLSVKSLSRDSALLCFTLRKPMLVPQYVRRLLGTKLSVTLAKHVLDSVLEIEVDGVFVTGLAAHSVLFVDVDSRSRESSGPSASIDAIKFAYSLRSYDARRLSWRLYSYNTIPTTPSYLAQFHSDLAVKEYLGLSDGGAALALLSRDWASTPMPDGWLSWRAPSTRSEDHDSHTVGPTFKLYVSPMPEVLPEALQVLVSTAARFRAHQFKVGGNVGGLLRPDKLIAYFKREDDLQACAEELARRLNDCPAQGVPFTAGIGGHGLLSWGLDPPEVERAGLLVPMRESWRYWITNRLGVALASMRQGARQFDLAAQPWRPALERLELEGIDTDTWTPRDGLWARRRESRAT
jgi:hypothetical protein